MAQGLIKATKNLFIGFINLDTAWTCPKDGIVITRAAQVTGGGTCYLYLKDLTLDVYVGQMIYPNADGLSMTCSFPVIKGHQYQIVAVEKIQYTTITYYQYA